MALNIKPKILTKACSNVENLANSEQVWRCKSTYASTTKNKQEDWPTLQEKKSNQTLKSRLNPAIFNPNCYFDNKKVSLRNEQSKCFQEASSTIKPSYLSSKNVSERNRSPKGFVSDQNITGKAKNYNPKHKERNFKTTPKMDNDEAWVTVMKKTSKKQAAKLDVKIPEQTNTESKENIQHIESEEKKQLKELRKERMKEKKKIKREAKAREVREKANKDTKVTIISQDMIDLISNQNNNSRNWKKPIQSYHTSLFEYPNLNSQQNHNFSKRNERLSNNTTDENNLHLTSAKSTTLNNEGNDTRKSTVDTSPLRYSQDVTIKKTTNINEEKVIKKATPVMSPIKKKNVKSKDPITLEIMDLIKEKKVKSKNEANQYQFKPVKKVPAVENLKKGKVFEGKKKKLTLLKNNMLREKKRQEQLLLALLNSKSLQVESDNKNEFNSIQETQTENLKFIDSKQNLAEENQNEKKCISKIEEAEEASLIKTNLSQSPEEEDSQSKECSKLSQKMPTSPTTELMINSEEARYQLIKESHILMDPIHSKKFREYCNHMLSPEIDQALLDFLQPLVMFQQRSYRQDPIKAKMKRRYFCGLKDALKHLNLNCVKCIVMAPNLQPSPGPGCIDELVYKVLRKAAECDVPVIFGLNHRQLGKICCIKGHASCITLGNIQGVQEKYEVLLGLVQEAKKRYEEVRAKSPFKHFTLSKGEEEIQREKSTEPTDPPLLVHKNDF